MINVIKSLFKRWEHIPFNGVESCIRDSLRPLIEDRSAEFKNGIKCANDRDDPAVALQLLWTELEIQESQIVMKQDQSFLCFLAGMETGLIARIKETP